MRMGHKEDVAEDSGAGGAGRGLKREEPGRLLTGVAGATWRSVGEGS